MLLLCRYSHKISSVICFRCIWWIVMQSTAYRLHRRNIVIPLVSCSHLEVFVWMCFIYTNRYLYACLYLHPFTQMQSYFPLYFKINLKIGFNAFMNIYQHFAISLVLRESGVCVCMCMSLYMWYELIFFTFCSVSRIAPPCGLAIERWCFHLANKF